MIDIKDLYDERFSAFERIRKNELWRILCQDFLQRFVNERDTVVDVGAGHCEFINNIHCKTNIALDINVSVAQYAAKDVNVINKPIKRLHSYFSENSIDVIFMSNVLEHLASKEEVFGLLKAAHLVLRKGGRILIMQPDISLVGHQYWDYFDHKVPLTYASLTEVLHADGFLITYAKYPFLPYTTKTKFLPLWPVLLKIYLRTRILQVLFGKQFFICAAK